MFVLRALDLCLLVLRPFYRDLGLGYDGLGLNWLWTQKLDIFCRTGKIENEKLGLAKKFIEFAALN